MTPRVFWDSELIKDMLAADIENVEERLLHATDEEMESVLIAIEQFVFWTAFVIRKLADSYKLSDEFEQITWEVKAYAKRPFGPPVDLLNWHRLDRHYGLTNPVPTQFTARKLCGLLIHSFVFMPEVAEVGEPDDSSLVIDALLFNSDHTKETALYRLDWSEFCKLIHALYDDDIVEFIHNRRTGKIIKRAQPPPEPPLP